MTSKIDFGSPDDQINAILITNNLVISQTNYVHSSQTWKFCLGMNRNQEQEKRIHVQTRKSS